MGITDGNGNLLCSYTYDEWGLPAVTANSDDTEIAEINPIRYRGYYYDNETGYYYLQSRYYDPSICRFINSDTYNYVDNTSHLGFNLFAYCGNNPINFSDHTGHDFTWQTVFDLFKAIFLLDDASKLSSNFAYFLGSIMASTKDFFANFNLDWYYQLKMNFISFMGSISYKLISILDKNFFIDLFTNTVEYGKMLFGKTLGDFQLNISYGNKEGLMAIVNNLISGFTEIGKIGSFSFGGVINLNKIGVYFQNTADFFDELFVSISWIKIFDDDDSNWDDSAFKDALVATGLSAASVAVICAFVKYAPPIITWLLKKVLPKVAFALA